MTKMLVLNSSILLLLLSSAAATLEANSAVRDINGKKLRVGTKYEIIPLRRGSGGGVTYEYGRDNITCPNAVVQEQLEVSRGTPVFFLPVNAKKGVVRLSTDMNVKFSVEDNGPTDHSCTSSFVWKIGAYQESTNLNFVTTGGTVGNPGPGTVGNWFKIVANKDAYNFLFCPSVCDFCKVICKNVGIYIDEDGVRRLVLSDGDHPIFNVWFRKV